MFNVRNYRNEFALLALFIIVNIIMYLFSIDAAPLSAGADVGQYLRPARSLVDYGEFTMNPPGWTPDMGESRSFTFGTPLYSILLAIPYYFFGQGEVFYAAVVIIQCSLLYLTGWISRLFLSFFNSRRAMLLHALIVFNPNSLTTAHLMQSETLFTLFIVIALLYIFKYIKYGSKSSLVIIGISAGLLTLTRPAGLYFVYTIPIILIAIQLFRLFQNKGKSKRRSVFSISLVSFVVPVLVAFLVMSPWYVRNYINSGQPFLTSESGIYLKDNYQTLIHRGRTGLTEQEAFKVSDSKQLEYFKNNGLSSKCLTDERNPNCTKHVFNAVLAGILDESIETHARALFHSFGVLYFSGGASNFRNYVGLEGNSTILAFQREAFQGIDSIVKLIKRMDIGYFLIFIIFTSFSVITRLIGLVGFYKTVKNPENIPYIIAIVGILAIFTAMYLYLGQSRFRVPLEPILMLLTVLAFSKKK